ncbi:MAG TPA: (2Fe-2S)-binding protein, partial [Chlorobaculum parvum]|nr:(2Fe-2S)-binding protein [Chlorobaculum parvum]
LDGAGAASGAVASIPKREVPVTGWLQHTSEAGIPLLVARRGAEWVALDGRCTHMGCPVGPEAGTDGLYCPCHAGRFDAEGVPFSGPPKAPLARLDVREAGEMLVIGQASSASSPAVVTSEELPCDYCVVASDVRGTRELIAATQPGNRDFASHIAALGEADPYVVWRVWLDRPVSSADFPFYTVSGYTYTDSISFYSSFQQPFIDWAKRTGGCVAELHAYAVAPQDIRPEPEIRAAMQQELYAMFPETRKATIRHEIFMMQSNFTRWAPGDHATRPGVETPYANLFLAGDWVSTKAPVFLMEAAAFTGRQAANAIAAKESLRQRPLPIVPMDGIFA